MDTLTPEQRSVRMGRVRGKDTSPELKVRRLLHRLGYRYRLHARDLPGRPDLIFRKRRKAIFVHGCFWHQHPDPACGLARQPKSRQEFWLAKFAANVARDGRVVKALSEAGWQVFVVWECELRDLGGLEARLRGFLDE
jgi:DNA mismatch endonuclease (patch repair protein)